MPKVKLFPYLRDLNAQNELRQVAETLRDFAEEKADKGLQNDIILFLGGLTGLEQQIAREIISAENLKIEQAQKRNALNYHIDRAAKKYGEEVEIEVNEPVGSNEVKDSSNTGGNSVVVNGDGNTIIQGTTNSKVNINTGQPTPNQPGQQEQKKDTILFLASSPTDQARLQWQKEFTNISQSLQSTPNNFELFSYRAVDVRLLQESLLKHKPQVVHFSGHGQQANSINAAGGIFLEDESSKEAKLVKAEALAKLFALMRKKFNLDIVVLNSCYSEDQAKALQAEVPYVIGMNAAVKDSVAIQFAEGLYRGLANHPDDVPYAFELAVVDLELQGMDQADLPVLLVKES
jgi:hypothetical protein